MKNTIISILEFFLFVPFLIVLLLQASVSLLTWALLFIGTTSLKLQTYLKELK